MVLYGQQSVFVNHLLIVWVEPVMDFGQIEKAH